MVAEISNLTPREIWWDLDLVEGYHYVAKWWARRSIYLKKPTAPAALSRLRV